MSVETPNSSTTPAMPGMITAEENATEKHTRLRVMVISHLRAFDQFFGFALSLGGKTTILHFLT